MVPRFELSDAGYDPNEEQAEDWAFDSPMETDPENAGINTPSDKADHESPQHKRPKQTVQVILSKAAQDNLTCNPACRLAASECSARELFSVALRNPNGVLAIANAHRIPTVC